MNSTESSEIKENWLKEPITKVYSRRRKLKINSHDSRIDLEIGKSINALNFDYCDDLKLPIIVTKLYYVYSSSNISVRFLLASLTSV